MNSVGEDSYERHWSVSIYYTRAGSYADKPGYLENSEGDKFFDRRSWIARGVLPLQLSLLAIEMHDLVIYSDWWGLS